MLFNQATMFQLAELNETVQEAKEAGRDADCDNEDLIDSLHYQNILG